MAQIEVREPYDCNWCDNRNDDRCYHEGFGECVENFFGNVVNDEKCPSYSIDPPHDCGNCRTKKPTIFPRPCAAPEDIKERFFGRSDVTEHCPYYNDGYMEVCGG